VKYEEPYLKDYASVGEARGGLERYFEFYNHHRPHQALDYRTPAVVYFDDRGKGEEAVPGERLVAAVTPVALPAPSCLPCSAQAGRCGNGECWKPS